MGNDHEGAQVQITHPSGATGKSRRMSIGTMIKDELRSLNKSENGKYESSLYLYSKPLLYADMPKPAQYVNSSQVSLRHLHDHTARILLLRLRVEHFTLRTQPVTLSHQLIQLLSALQHTLDRLM